jgi:ADP-heptose:LPS heptosyltransferase
MKVVLVRQRPAFGDALLLGPLIQAIKAKHLNSHLTVITDPTYMAGALPLIFAGIPGVDRIECVSSMEWTTESNKVIEPILCAASMEMPFTAQTADMLLDCNGGYMTFERAHNGDIPFGIQEFWAREYGYYTPALDLRPKWNIPEKAEIEVDQWLQDVNREKKPVVGIVLRAGDAIRNWGHHKVTDIADWLHTRGLFPISIDPHIPIRSIYGASCVGRRLDFVAALLKRSRLVLTPDTGLLHLAEAVGTPTVALWGIMRPELRMEGYNCRVVPEQSLGQCENDDCPCCRWKFQQWSCTYRITLSMILKGLKDSL